MCPGPCALWVGNCQVTEACSKILAELTGMSTWKAQITPDLSVGVPCPLERCVHVLQGSGMSLITWGCLVGFGVVLLFLVLRTWRSDVSNNCQIPQLLNFAFSWFTALLLSHEQFELTTQTWQEFPDEIKKVACSPGSVILMRLQITVEQGKAAPWECDSDVYAGHFRTNGKCLYFNNNNKKRQCF